MIPWSAMVMNWNSNQCLVALQTPEEPPPATQALAPGAFSSTPGSASLHSMGSQPSHPPLRPEALPAGTAPGPGTDAGGVLRGVGGFGGTGGVGGLGTMAGSGALTGLGGFGELGRRGEATQGAGVTLPPDRRFWLEFHEAVGLTPEQFRDLISQRDQVKEAIGEMRHQVREGPM